MTNPALVLDKNKPSTDYIFKYLFAVRTTREAVIDMDRAQEFGIRSSGDKKVDKDLAGSPVYPFLNIAKIAEIVDNGFYLGLCNPKEDAARMYSYIQFHLETWVAIVKSSVNTVEAPVEDLLKLDNLAKHVYHVSSHYMEVPRASSFEDFFKRGSTKRNGLGALGGSFEDLMEQPGTRDAPEHVSYQDDLIAHQAKILGFTR